MSDIVESSDSAVDSEKFMIFSVLGKLYSFPSRLIGEIALFDTVYPLPLMPSYVLGVVNRYSVPYALFDIGLLLHDKHCPRNKVIVFKDKIDHIAFLIDDVISIEDIQPENMLIPENNSDSVDLPDVISSSFNWNNNLVSVLDYNHIINRQKEFLK